MKLSVLASVLQTEISLSPETGDLEVTDIVQDSRKVKPGALFVAVRGFHSDGHQFIPQAIRQGAAAIVAESGKADAASEAPIILVPDARKALAELAARFYEYPSEKLSLIGITGTKGKTTTSYLIRSIIDAAGEKTGLIGTIDYRVGDKVYPAPNTTPESLDLQKLLREMVDAGVKYCVTEVSSHALALGRTNRCAFKAAVFTNLTQDHLDFHLDMGSYREAKLLLFTGLAQGSSAVVNGDDPVSTEIVKRTKVKVCTYGLSRMNDIHPEGNILSGMSGLRFTVRLPGGAVGVESPLVGMHNVSNILAAIGAGFSQGFGPEIISTGIRNMKAVPGRMEPVSEGQPFGVIVDYAHTEDSLARLLEAVRGVGPKRVITVFGCGGDRDRTKRPKMGAAAFEGSDLIIVTTDNPRTEDPDDIIRQVEAGMPGEAKVPVLGVESHTGAGSKKYAVVPDRAAAIETAVGIAAPGDVVVLAGKGHEDYQIIGETKFHFDDREVAREAIRKMSAFNGRSEKK